MKAGSEALVAFLKETISTPYPPASDPYSPPHTRSGKLIRELYATVEGESLAFGDTAEHAAYLEFGTWKMLPRPFLANGFENGGKEAMLQAYEDAFNA